MVGILYARKSKIIYYNSYIFIILSIKSKIWISNFGIIIILKLSNNIISDIKGIEAILFHKSKNIFKREKIVIIFNYF